MQVIGIVVDNYKLDIYKTKLQEGGFLDFAVTKHTPTSSMIKLKVQPAEVMTISQLCTLIEAQFADLD